MIEKVKDKEWDGSFRNDEINLFKGLFCCLFVKHTIFKIIPILPLVEPCAATGKRCWLLLRRVGPASGPQLGCPGEPLWPPEPHSQPATSMALVILHLQNLYVTGCICLAIEGGVLFLLCNFSTHCLRCIWNSGLKLNRSISCLHYLCGENFWDGRKVLPPWQSPSHSRLQGPNLRPHLPPLSGLCHRWRVRLHQSLRRPHLECDRLWWTNVSANSTNRNKNGGWNQ